MKLLQAFIAAAILLGLVSSCEDGTSKIGNSLVDDQTSIVIDSAFTLTGYSVANESVESRTITQLLGAIDAKEFGSFYSDFVTQFMPAEKLDTTGVSVEDIDSVRLLMFFVPGELTGDSIVPMGFKVYPLTRQLQAPIYSNFNPEGYYNEADSWTKTNHIYTANNLATDSAVATYGIFVKLPLDFGKKVFRRYETNPETFSTPEAFANFFPGIYVKSTFGTGRVVNIANTRINFYYKKHTPYTDSLGVVKDSIENTIATYMAVSPEVITNNNIRMKISPSLKQQADNGDALLVAPTGYISRLTFPAQAIIDSYKAHGGTMSVINTLTMEIPVEEIKNNYSINPPDNVLLILTSKKADFFANNEIADNKTSFLGTYSSTTKSYSFSGLRDYILNMISKGTLTPDDYTFDLIPVNVTREASTDNYYGQTTYVITSIQPSVSVPSMCRLKLEDAKIKFTYSKNS